ncbi:hypothetical protein CIHG_01512 [Coccidioides immitis H538.4]|uniref:Uncharacterized protein n=1 Tax=Coccidioides immitis H538.4 TaxID=396776 RepID=A0A0J8RIC7_COCIT|nr:hypothetical protein CIHG_01512 [Coccidioides immitis H538.4]
MTKPRTHSPVSWFQPYMNLIWVSAKTYKARANPVEISSFGSKRACLLRRSHQIRRKAITQRLGSNETSLWHLAILDNLEIHTISPSGFWLVPFYETLVPGSKDEQEPTKGTLAMGM